MTKAQKKKLQELTQLRDDTIRDFDSKLEVLRVEIGTEDILTFSQPNQKSCKCGAEKTTSYFMPSYCPLCKTFTHTAYLG